MARSERGAESYLVEREGLTQGRRAIGYGCAGEVGGGGGHWGHLRKRFDVVNVACVLLNIGRRAVVFATQPMNEVERKDI